MDIRREPIKEGEDGIQNCTCKELKKKFSICYLDFKYNASRDFLTSNDLRNDPFGGQRYAK